MACLSTADGSVDLKLSTVNLDIDALLLSMTEIRQMADSPQAKPAQTVSTWGLPAEPAQSPVERLTEKKAKDPKMVAAGRAGAAARQKRLLEQLQAAKEPLRPGDGTSAPPKKADQERTDKRCRQTEHNRNWIPWIIGACIAGGSLADVFAGFARGNMRLRASPTSVAQAPRPKSRINLPN